MYEKDESTSDTSEPIVNPPVQAKYTIVPKFFSGNPTEIPVIDFVGCINKFTHENYIHFIDLDGRIGKIKLNDVGIIFTVNPSKEDVDDFIRIKKESETIDPTKKKDGLEYYS